MVTSLCFTQHGGSFVRVPNSSLEKFLSQRLGQPEIEELRPEIAGLTEAGSKWLTVALDPMHDARVVPDGLPDADSRPSVVLRIERSVQVAKPTAAATTWSFAVAVGQDLGAHNMFPGAFCRGLSTNGFTQIQQNYNGATYLNATMPDFIDWRGCTRFAGAGTPRGLVNADMYDTDVTVFSPNGSNQYNVPASTLTVGPYGTTAGIIPNGYDLTLENSWSRLIAGGVELINTTADLYKQGTITVGEVPCSIAHGSCALWDASDAANPPPQSGAGNPIRDGFHKVPFVMTTAPAASITEAQSYLRTTQLQAKDGVYVPMRIDHSRNGFDHMSCMHRVITNSTEQYDLVPGVPGAAPVDPTGFANPNMRYEIATAAGLALSMSPKVTQITPTQTSTILCTGLSAQSTFTLRVVMYLEIAPQLHDSNYGNFVFSAKPSPPMDARALRLYDVLSQKLPVGVPQTMNPAGEWWAMVRDTIRKFASPIANIASLIPNPVAQGIAMGARAVANLSQNNSRSSSVNSIRAITPRVNKSTTKKKKQVSLKGVKR